TKEQLSQLGWIYINMLILQLRVPRNRLERLNFQLRITGYARTFQTVLLARLFPSPGKTMTLPSLSFTTLILIFRGGLLIPLCQSILFVSSLRETSVVFIL